MAHVFKWKAIYRIVKNQRSPEIEETGKAFSVEFASLLGASSWCLRYLARVTVRKAVRALTETTVRRGLATLVKNQISFFRAWGYLIKWEMLESLKDALTKEIERQGPGGTGGSGETIDRPAGLPTDIVT